MELSERYNYDEFTRDKVLPWMKFNDSPPLGQRAPDFPLWELDNRLQDGPHTSLSEIWSKHSYTIVEFGSFT